MRTNSCGACVREMSFSLRECGSRSELNCDAEWRGVSRAQTPFADRLFRKPVQPRVRCVQLQSRLFTLPFATRVFKKKKKNDKKCKRVCVVVSCGGRGCGGGDGGADGALTAMSLSTTLHAHAWNEGDRKSGSQTPGVPVTNEPSTINRCWPSGAPKKSPAQFTNFLSMKCHTHRVLHCLDHPGTKNVLSEHFVGTGPCTNLPWNPAPYAARNEETISACRRT